MVKFKSVITSFEDDCKIKSDDGKYFEICFDSIKNYVVRSMEKAGGTSPVTAVDGMLDVTDTFEEYIVVLRADAPLITTQTVADALEYHKASNNDVTALLPPKESGEDDFGMYIFTTSSVEKNFNISEEYKRLCGKKHGCFTVGDFSEVFDVFDRLQLARAEKIMQKRINDSLMSKGVIMHLPETSLISPNAEIMPGTEIFPSTVIEGKVSIGRMCVITSTSRLKDCEIGDKVTVQSSVILNSKIGSGTTVGPFAYIRPDSVVGENVRIGDFVELKNTNIGNGTKVSHLTYVGDADVGENCNFGCGTVTVNYDGKKKYRTKIGNKVFVGCNSNLVAPVTLADGAYTAAGSTITDDVAENNLAIARARQVNKEKWNDRRN